MSALHKLQHIVAAKAAEADAAALAAQAALDHRYYPPGLSIPSFVPNSMSPLECITTFLSTSLIALAAFHSAARQLNPELGWKDGLCACWFAFCAGIHAVLEGYWVFRAISGTGVARYADVLAQVWKEAALGDSRYAAASDDALICHELVTVVLLAPLCAVTAVLFARGSPRRWAAALLASSAHVFSVALYFVGAGCQEWVRGGGFSYSRPEAMYYWGYFVGSNITWGIVPAGEFIVSSPPSFKFLLVRFYSWLCSRRRAVSTVV